MPDPAVDGDGDDPESVVITMRVADMPTAPVPGSDQVACDRCTEAVWLSPATQRSIEIGLYPEEPIWCLPCAIAHEEGNR